MRPRAGLSTRGGSALRLKSVPPAFGMRAYWAWPPGREGMPSRQEWMHRQVKPMRQKLCVWCGFGAVSGCGCGCGWDRAQARWDVLAFSARHREGRDDLVADLERGVEFGPSLCSGVGVEARSERDDFADELVSAGEAIRSYVRCACIAVLQ